MTKSIYIWLALVAGPVVCGVAQKVTLIKLGILHKPLGDGEYWLCVPFVFLSVYLAIKMAKLSINKIRIMWCFAVVTAFIIYVNAFIFMEMHELEGQRISGIGISPRNALIWLLLPFSTTCLMWVAMLVGRSLGELLGKGRWGQAWISKQTQSSCNISMRYPISHLSIPSSHQNR